MNETVPEEKLRQRIRDFLSLPPRERSEEERIELLRLLGVPHPEHFVQAVWSSTWLLGIDRLLDPDSLYFRPLEYSDFHFKWARGAFNHLPPEVKTRFFSLKIEPTGFEPALRTLCAKLGIEVQRYTLLDVEVADKIHAECALTVLLNDQVVRIIEISHFKLAGEEIFAALAELTNVKIEPVHIYTTPQGTKVALETRISKHPLYSEELEEPFYLENWHTLLRSGAQQDALGDAIGSIARDVHYRVTEAGEVVTTHHRELFHDLSGYTFGFTEPIYHFLDTRLPETFRVSSQPRLTYLFNQYQEAYLQKNRELRDQWQEIEALLWKMEPLIREYLGPEADVEAAIQGVKSRIFRDPRKWLNEVFAVFLV
jgi:hypothetical protein